MAVAETDAEHVVSLAKHAGRSFVSSAISYS